MTSILLQLNWRAVGLAALQGACIALAVGLAASATTRGAARLITGDEALAPIAVVLVATAAVRSRAILQLAARMRWPARTTAGHR